MTPDPPFRLVVSGAVMQRIRAVREEAGLLARDEEYLSFLRTMVDELQTRPLDWGDPLFMLHQIGVLVHHQLSGSFSATYGVDPIRRIVYLRDVRLTTDID